MADGGASSSPPANPGAPAASGEAVAKAPPKKKSEQTKAERRELQEAQRAAKAAKKAAEAGGQPQSQKPKPLAPPRPQPATPSANVSDNGPGLNLAPGVSTASTTSSSAASSSAGASTTPSVKGKGSIASVVPPPAKLVANASSKTSTKSGKAKKTVKPLVDTTDIHPSILRLGAWYKNRTVRGGNARCIAMLLAFKELIQDYQTPAGKTIDRDLVTSLNKPINYLITCRKMSVSMGNAIASLKQKIGQISEGNLCVTEEAFKKEVIKSIDAFISERIVLAGKCMVDLATTRVVDGDVLLIYGRSTVVEMTLKAAHKAGKRFSVIVVDSRPYCEGRDVARRLAACGIDATYVLLSSISTVIGGVTKVLIGAAAVLTNGHVYSRVGTALVCLMASEFHKPVLCCSETYKFTEKTWLNSLTENEEGDPASLVTIEDSESGTRSPLADWQAIDNLTLSNYQYDLTPPEYISMLITEVGMVPPTSVPVIIREFHLKVGEKDGRRGTAERAE